MFGNESKPARIYAYKAKEPDCIDAVMNQLRLAHRYHNTLVEIERTRRDRVDTAIREHSPEVLTSQARIDESSVAIDTINSAIKLRSQRERRRTVATEVERTQLRDHKAARKLARDDHKAARKAAFADGSLKPTLETIDTEADAANKDARAACGLYWGTYSNVEAATRQIRKGAPPKFHRWDGEGSLAVQLQGGLEWAASVTGEDTRIRVRLQTLASRPCVNKKGMPIPVADPDSRRSREKSRAVVWFRIGSENHGKPVWCKIPIHLHRHPPAGSVIKWARLHRTITGDRVLWQVQFVLCRDDWDRDGMPDDGVAGVDINYRMTPSGLRVATVMGGDGNRMALVLPSSWLSAWEKAESLQSIRDRNFDEVRERLAAWLDSREVPEWMSERSAHLRMWKGIGRLASLVRHWRENRFDGDEDIFAAMESWRKQDRHLHDWQDSQEKKIARRRDDLYRKFALAVARRYQTLHMEDTDWKKLRARPAPDADQNIPARLYANIAAPGRLTEIFREMAVDWIQFDAALTTQRCHSCGHVNNFDASANLTHTCAGCGLTWDQDDNAGLNLLNAAPGTEKKRKGNRNPVPDLDAAR